MATKRFEISGYGQVELNNVAFRRDGRIEAQCAPDTTDFASIPVENGMMLAVDDAKHCVKLATDDTLPIALVYSTEHMYDERTPGLKNFKLNGSDDFFPRLGYLAIGDKWHTNCVCYDDGEFTAEENLIDALKACAETPVYGGADACGAIKLSATEPAYGPVLKVTAYATMPDGQPAVKLQVLKFHN